MGTLGLARTAEARFVGKATMELKPSFPVQSAYASVAKAVFEHTLHINNIETSLQHITKVEDYH